MAAAVVFSVSAFAAEAITEALPVSVLKIVKNNMCALHWTCLRNCCALHKNGYNYAAELDFRIFSGYNGITNRKRRCLLC